MDEDGELVVDSDVAFGEIIIKQFSEVEEQQNSAVASARTSRGIQVGPDGGEGVPLQDGHEVRVPGPDWMAWSVMDRIDAAGLAGSPSVIGQQVPVDRVRAGRRRRVDGACVR